jgi:hypothetical protein
MRIGGPERDIRPQAGFGPRPAVCSSEPSIQELRVKSGAAKAA